jgi:hypothetical protein
MAKARSNIEKFLSLPEKKKQAAVRDALEAEPKALSVRERAKWEKVRAGLKKSHAAKRGRPRTGKGVKVIALSVEKSLLARADARAKAEGVSRAALIARGLEAVLAA